MTKGGASRSIVVGTGGGSPWNLPGQCSASSFAPSVPCLTSSTSGKMVQPWERHNIFDGDSVDASVVVCKFFKMKKTRF